MLKKFIREQLTDMSIIKISDDSEYDSDYIDNMIRHYYNFFKESNREHFKKEIKKMQVENSSDQLEKKKEIEVQNQLVVQIQIQNNDLKLLKIWMKFFKKFSTNFFTGLF